MAEPAVENNDDSNASTEGGVTGKGWVKGQSGNPGGRPKGLARKVREIVGDNDGEMIARFWAAALGGRMTNPAWDTEKTAEQQPGVSQYIDVEPKDRILVSKLLAERGWGKPPQFAPIEDDDPLDFSEREANELAAGLDARLDELAAARARRTASDAATG